MANHLGNVLAVVSDKKVQSDGVTWSAIVLSAQDYFPFGMAMPGRSTDTKHRYGFNGKETDPETGIQDYGMRWYLPNLGRFPSVDPLTAKYPFYTPYQFAGNMPIQFIDLDGCEPADPETKWTPRPEYDTQTGGNHYSTSDGYYVYKQGDTYNWSKIGDTQWNPDANWKPTDHIDKRPVGIPAQTIDNKWVTEFHAYTRSMSPMLSFSAGYAELAGNVALGGIDGIVGLSASAMIPRMVVEKPNLITLYRGTNFSSEIRVFEETGHIMSDAARSAYREGRPFADAVATHNKWLKIWYENLDTYAKAHSMFGTELPAAWNMERTLISWTSKPEVAQSFGTTVFQTTVPLNAVLKQTLSTSTEAEYLIINRVKATLYVPK